MDNDEVGKMVVMARVRPFNDRERNQKRAVTVDEQTQTLKVQFGMRPEMVSSPLCDKILFNLKYSVEQHLNLYL